MGKGSVSHKMKQRKAHQKHQRIEKRRAKGKSGPRPMLKDRSNTFTPQPEPRRSMYGY